MAGAIHSTLNGINPIDGYRQDAAQADAIALSLVGLDFVPASYNWEMIGRPFNSVAGGAGPLPVSLGTAATASFTVDSDVGSVSLDGAYIVRCTMNGNSPSQQVLEVGIVRLAPGVTIPGLSGPIVLRKMGVFEGVSIDTLDANYLAGWCKQLNFWLELVRQLATGSVPTPTADALATTLTNATGSTATIGQVVRISSNNHFQLATATPAASSPVIPIGAVLDATILNNAVGRICPSGIAQVKMDGSSTPSAGQTLYVSALTAGSATTVVPDGHFIEAIGTVVDVSTYAGAGSLILAMIRVPEAPAQVARQESHFASSVGATTITLASPQLNLSMAYLIKARIVAFDDQGGGHASVFELTVGIKGGVLLGAVVPGINEGTFLGSVTIDTSLGQLRVRGTSPGGNVNWSTVIDITSVIAPGAS